MKFIHDNFSINKEISGSGCQQPPKKHINSTVESHFCGNGFNGILHLRNKINRSQIFSGCHNVIFYKLDLTVFGF